MIPVKTFGDYVVCFEAEPETNINMRSHFIKECGWTVSQYRRIEKFAWFSARVSIWKDGKELAEEFLGGCSYQTSREFFTTYEGDYFCDMVRTCAREIGDPALMRVVDAWHSSFRQAEAA